MRSYVFTDRELAKHAGRFVWLSIDTEKQNNAAFLEQFPIDAYPTLLVIDPAKPEVAFKWLGSATVKQLERLLDDGERAVRGVGATPTGAALLRADRLYAARQLDEAAAAYEGVLAEAPGDWPGRSRAVESLVTSHLEAGRLESCARRAAELTPGLPRGPSFANAVMLGVSCVLEDDGKSAWRAPLRVKLEALAREAVSLPGLLADDRSGLWAVLADCAGARGDEAGEKKTALEWLSFLEAEAARAPSPEARSVFDPHRVSAALRAKDPLRAVPALERSEKDLPSDYNPPARLALLYAELGRLDDALAANSRALALVHGPRRLQVLQARAGLLLKKGDPAAARSALHEARTFAGSLPAGQRSERALKRLEAAIEKLPPSP